MAFMLRAASAAIFLGLSLAAGVAQTSTPSAAMQGFHSRARLMSGGQQGDIWLAGIEITLDQGFKTYWRTPGDSGLPPRFDWSGSENVAATEVRWPAPSRHEDAAGVAYVYGKRVVLPVLVKPKDKDKPVKLALKAEYGVCKDICIPAHADLGLDLAGEDSGRGAIEAALAKVPLPQGLGTKAEVSVLSIEPRPGDKPAFSITVRAPSGAKPALFAEGPENWYLSTSLPDDANRFTVTVEEKPRDASNSIPLRLTLVAGDKAVETEVSLDANHRAREGTLKSAFWRIGPCPSRLENACPRSPSAS
jgi:DsbC/DsbD-like thiol-disulfide interchange protein